MKDAQQIMQEIILLTTNIETNYPELYKYLDETPIWKSNQEWKEISPMDLENYLNTLKGQLRNYINMHKKQLLQEYH